MAPFPEIGSGRPLHVQTKRVLCNMYKHFQEVCDKDINCLSTPKQLVIKISGVPKKLVLNTLKEFESMQFNQKFKTPIKKSKRKSRITVDEFDREVIRRTIHNFHITNKETPTLKLILEKLKDDIDYRGSITTLRKHVSLLGFKWQKTEDNRRLLMEKHEIRNLRINFLCKINEYRAQGRPIVFTDETYIDTSHSTQKSWSDGSTNGMKQPVSKGKRLVIVHAGGMEGFVPNALVIYEAHKKTGDYHDNMNFDNYSKWIKTQLIPNLKPNSVVVLDNACYHNSLQNPAPNSNSRKQVMMDWLSQRNIDHSPTMYKTQLYDLVLKNKQRFVEYKIDTILSQHGHTALRLPPYHPQFNPIENIWGIVKGFVAKKNVSMNMESIKHLAEEKISRITQEEWKNVCFHTMKEEQKYQCQESQMDAISESFIISVSDENEDDEMTSD